MSAKTKHWINNLEPGLETLDGPDLTAKVSIAISLKRIADKLEDCDLKKTIFEAVQSAMVRDRIDRR